MVTGPFTELVPWRQAQLLILDPMTIQALLDYQRMHWEQRQVWVSAEQAYRAMREQMRDAT